MRIQITMPSERPRLSGTYFPYAAVSRDAGSPACSLQSPSYAAWLSCASVVLCISARR